MSRRMIDSKTIIKSQIVDDKNVVYLNEILEKYGTEIDDSKSITLQFYSKEAWDDGGAVLDSDTGTKCSIIPNTAITITKYEGTLYIKGLLVDNFKTMNFLYYIEIPDGDYEKGITLRDVYEFDVHVIKV